jgi:dihydroorotate dehydrogenase
LVKDGTATSKAMNKVIIGAPFGNWFNFDGATSTIGSFTKEHRGGIFKRAWRILKTLRYLRRPQSWINQLGLPSPSINSLAYTAADNKIISIYGFTKQEWIYLADAACIRVTPLAVEFNLSCPNVNHKQTLLNIAHAVKITQDHGKLLIAKLPPIRWFDLGIPLFDLGVTHFHLCNTIPTPGGGLSGKVLKQYSLWAINEFREKWGHKVTLIGGGGITSLEDVREYINNGADHVAVASMLINPFNWKKLKWIIKIFSPNAKNPK